MVCFIPSNFLKAVFHKFYLVQSWIFCIYVTKLSCSAGHTALFKIAVVLLRADLNFQAIFESGNILLNIGARWSAVRKERLYCTIKSICIPVTLIIEPLTSNDVLVKKLSALRVFLIYFSIVLRCGVLYCCFTSRRPIWWYVIFRLHRIQ